MVDELPGLKFLPGPARGIVSLRAQIFDPAAGGIAQTKRELPLVLHMADAAPKSEVGAWNTTAAPPWKDANKQGGAVHMSGEARASNPSLPSRERKTADLVSAPRSGEGNTAPTAQRENPTRPTTIEREEAYPVVTSAKTGEARGAEQSAVSRSAPRPARSSLPPGTPSPGRSGSGPDGRSVATAITRTL